MSIPVSALLFDLDGTLIDSRHDLAESVRWIQGQYNVAPSDDATVGKYIGDGAGVLVQRALRLEDKPELEKATQRFKDHYREHCMDTTRPYPGVIEVLDYFSKKPLALVTNKPVRITHRILKGLGLDNYFPVVFGGDSVEKKKPNPEALLRALQELNIPVNSAAIMIGDSSNDILAGKAAGIKTCGVYSNIGDHSTLLNSLPDHLIHDMRDLMRLLE